MKKLTVRETAVFAILGALMYGCKALTDALPNIHLLGSFIVAITVVYRKKALYPIYVYVFINGMMTGFSTWWIPYLYIWTILWAVVMILPRNLPEKYARIMYMAVCALHGYMFGILYAPAQALLFGLDYNGMVAWIMAGLPFDFIHGTSNLLCGMLIMPMVKTLRTAEKASKSI